MRDSFFPLRVDPMGQCVIFAGALFLSFSLRLLLELDFDLLGVLFPNKE